MRDKKLREFLGVKEVGGLMMTHNEYGHIQRISNLETRMRLLFEHLGLIYIDKPGLDEKLPRIEKAKKTKTTSSSTST